MTSLHLPSRRSLHFSNIQRASTDSGLSSPRQATANVTEPNAKPMTPMERMKAASRRAQDRLSEQRKEYEANATQGGLAPSSAFGRELKRKAFQPTGLLVEDAFEKRNPSNMEQALNPRPAARLRWQRKMVIREIRHRGRLTKEMKIARTERSHMSRSHFFKTSMKKLAPLARQIAGKSIDEAILQMRFSNKRVAQDVRQHLIQARNEAIVVKGMGLGRAGSENENSTELLHSDPSETPPLPHQTPLKTYKKGAAPDPTDMYVAQAWTNRGPYGQEPDYRARGRMYIMRPPHTGITVLLKEEKTRTREKAEKEARALKKRLGKNMWVHLPDRPVTTQRQHILW
ncbi:uncharacterized protein Z519_09788 [Cladophialophora bantiana CBS 173.52]|uniref:Ribosomal protein L22 n=1 Tax=Cladophialophora bantiana (strain ATCC 10958 / CBS 173.52 / CDC B-1940 / NIH 8579) TaxID=1442370 RepID=A0A0D2FSU6_CLAB1|nr:uncharacterized protein Z519_09788 [Cladophialophora bantiana CBS 173.52]KIW89632.1 hypothetical protein Z519_09788 [Cladophialophora bantiana CBS 173.52]